MKKLVSWAVAAVLAFSSVSALAANIYGIESPVTVNVDFDTKIGKSVANVADYPTEPEALVIETKDSATIEAKATISMVEVAEKWDEYITLAANYADNFGLSAEAARAAILSYTELTGDFNLEIRVDKAISNAAANIIWSSNVTNLFTEESRSLDESNPDYNVMNVHMVIADDTTNEELDEYFMGILADPQTSNETMTLTLRNTLVDGDFDVPYEIYTHFYGDVTIGVPSADDMIVEWDEEDLNYVELKEKTFGGAGGPVSTPKPTEAPTAEPTPTPEPQTGGTDSGAKLNYDDHFAYIIGYDPLEDGSIEVRPTNNITRAEVATIFYRLLDADSRVKFKTGDNDFSDVDASDWYNMAVSTATAAGIFEGYDDGTFGPDKPITRAEFATIASRFSSLEYNGEPMFTDIAGHWAEEGINRAAVTGWVNGYDDGTFRPENAITRAEAITLINRVLYRNIDEEGLLLAGYLDFIDNDPSAWYYIAILEASNSHDYERPSIGQLEVHLHITEAPDWDADEETIDITDATLTE